MTCPKCTTVSKPTKWQHPMPPDAPKTDIEKLKELLTSFGVGYKVEGDLLICEEGGAKIGGYTTFYATFKFDQHGSFIRMEVGE